MRPIVLLDVDGPLADFTRAYLDLFEGITGEQATHADVTQWSISSCDFFLRGAEKMGITREALRKHIDEKVAAPGFAAAIPVQPDAVIAVSRLHDLAEVWAITSPWDASPTWQYERARWLTKHFGIARGHVIQCGKKHRVHGHLFVDDKEEHVVEWSEQWPDETALLFGMHHNERAPGNANVLRGGWDLVLEIAANKARDHRLAKALWLADGGR